MPDLKRVFEDMGLSEIKTYIQSGNVLFRSNAAEEPLRKKNELLIDVIFELPVTVILRTAAELERIIRNCPFSKEAISEVDSSLVGENL